MRWISSFWSGLKWVQRARVAAVQHNEELAEAGSAMAQYGLGERYYDGLGRPRDYEMALKWFLRSAKQGHGRARLNAGMMLFLGRGCAPDHPEAVKWLVLAANGGEGKAQAALETIAKRLATETIEEGRRRAAAYPTNMIKP